MTPTNDIDIDDLVNDAVSDSTGQQQQQQPLPGGGALSCSRLSIANLKQILDKRADAQPKKFLYDCIHRSEYGCAELLSEVGRGYLAYDRAGEMWHIFNGLHWEADIGGNIAGLTSHVLSAVYRKTALDKHAERLAYQALLSDPAKPTDAEKQHIANLREDEKAAESQAYRLYEMKLINNVLKFAGASELLGVLSEVWDAQTHLFGVKNGVIDLVTGQPVTPSPDQFIRTVAPTAFDPNATCPIFEKAILEIFAGNKEMVAYVPRLLGYAITGTCQESDFSVWYGKDGRNGKEFILDRTQATIGDKLAGVIESELLLSSKSQRVKNSATEGLMVLRGRRLAWATETNEGRSYDSSAMKDLSGGHLMTGRHNHGRQEQWRRTHTVILLTNHKPHVAGGGGGAEWDRIKLLEFTESFVNDPDPKNPHQHKKDATLGDRIDKSELPGILNWLIRGALEWRKHGLQTPKSVTEATAKYRSEEDTLGGFIQDRCITVETPGEKLRVSAGELYAEYQQWSTKKQYSPMNARAFSNKIEDRGYLKKRYTSGEKFHGIRLPNAVEMIGRSSPVSDEVIDN